MRKWDSRYLLLKSFEANAGLRDRLRKKKMSWQFAIFVVKEFRGGRESERSIEKIGSRHLY